MRRQRRDVAKEEGSIIRNRLVAKQLCAVICRREGTLYRRPTFFVSPRGVHCTRASYKAHRTRESHKVLHNGDWKMILDAMARSYNENMA